MCYNLLMCPWTIINIVFFDGTGKMHAIFIKKKEYIIMRLLPCFQFSQVTEMIKCWSLSGSVMGRQPRAWRSIGIGLGLGLVNTD